MQQKQHWCAQHVAWWARPIFGSNSVGVSGNGSQCWYSMRCVEKIFIFLFLFFDFFHSNKIFIFLTFEIVVATFFNALLYFTVK